MSLAELYQDQGKYLEAEKHFEAALAEASKPELWPNQVPLVSTFIWFAKFYAGQRRYAEAESLFKRALEISEKESGGLLHYLREFAQLYQEQGKNDAAEELYLRALAISEKHHGPENPLTVFALGDLAAFYRATARFADAEISLRRVWAILERTAALETAAAGKFWRRLKCGRHALQRLIDSQQISIATALDQLAEVCEDQHKYGEAEPFRRRSIEIKEKAWAVSSSIFLADSLEAYAALLRKLGRETEAMEAEERARPIRAKHPKGSYVCHARVTGRAIPLDLDLRQRLWLFLHALRHPSRYQVR